MPADITALSDDDPATPDTATDGANFASANYSGIAGTVHCLGTDCKVENGVLTGSWYFQPTSTTAFYTRAATATDYTEEMNYARFGHWLSFDATSGDATVNTYAWSNGGTDMALDSNDDLGDRATYSGTAVGMSLHKTFDSQGEQQSIYSGRFTADVTLEADFDANPTVSGTVDNFQGPATDSSWSVELKEMALAATRAGTAGETSTGGTGADGVWNQRAYGNDATKRPAGIFGDFNAHWTDGHAAGAFATTNDD